MKVSVSTTLAQALPAEKSWWAVFADLFKARLTSLVLLTTMAGFYLGTAEANYALMFHAVLGMALVASGGAALNELFERDLDAKMHRTQDRPLPSGRMQPRAVQWIGWGCGISGVLYLGVLVNLLTAGLALFTLLTYLFVYTPLKRLHWLNTLVGAVPGAMPPLIGWTAARGELGSAGLALFALQACWQIPHFMAIAWIYRDEYARAGFKMLPAVDPRGKRTSRHALFFTAALLAVSVAPWQFGVAGPLYLAAALVLGAVFLWTAVRFARHLTLSHARQLFFASILYLPLLISALVLDKAR